VIAWLAVYIFACCVMASGYVSFSWRWHLFVWRLWREDPHGETFKPGGRWGFFVGGFEVGSRDSRDPFGCWMKDRGIWPW
jgi:hypothetical protein